MLTVTHKLPYTVLQPYVHKQIETNSAVILKNLTYCVYIALYKYLTNTFKTFPVDPFHK